MSDSEEYNKILKRIEKKLNRNPQLKRKLASHIESIEEILENKIDVTVVFDKGVDDYEDEFEKYQFNLDDHYESMELGEFINFIGEEDETYKVFIDPLYLKKGINNITNVLVTTIDDAVIIVPKSDKKDEK